MTTPLVTPGQGMADSVTAPVLPVAPAPQYFTAEQMAAARQQEKDKLYDRIQNTDIQLAQFKTALEELKTEKEARDTELETQRQAAADAKKKADEAKLTAEQLVARREEELSAQQAKFQKDMDFKLAVLAKEQEFQKTQSYAQRRVAEEVAANNIIPDLVEYIDGDTESEIEASIAKAKEKTASIVQGAASLTTPPVFNGVSPTGGPSGPLDMLTGPKQLTNEQVAAMNNAQYKKWREESGMARAGSGVGILGF